MKYTKLAEKVLKEAVKEALLLGHRFVGTEHILLAMAAVKGNYAGDLLKSYRVEADGIREFLSKMDMQASDVENDGQMAESPHVEILKKAAEEAAQKLGFEEVGTEHLLLALLSDPSFMAIRVLAMMGVNVPDMLNRVRQELGVPMPQDPHRVTPDGMMDEFSDPDTRSMTERFTKDLTDPQPLQKADPVIGRENEIERMMQILCRRTKNNPALIGEAGVGKTAIVEGLAKRIGSGDVPEMLKNKRILSLDMAAMIAGTKFRGEFEDRLKKLMDEITTDGRIILFMDEMHTLVGAGSAEGTMDAANILKPALSRGEIQLIGATTVSEYTKHIEKDGALNRRFQPILVEEPTEEETLAILKGLAHRYEAHHGVQYSEAALEAAVKLSHRYITDRSLPDKAIDLMDEAGARCRMKLFSKQEEAAHEAGAHEKAPENAAEASKRKEAAILRGDLETAQKMAALEQKLKKASEKAANAAAKGEKQELPAENRIEASDVEAVVSLWTGIPAGKIAETDAERLRHLEDNLHQRVIGQDEAVKAVAQAIRRGRLGLKDPKRPIGSFLLLGPTGVGKTELCKSLAEVLFGSEEALIRVDMSEYMEKYSVSKLIGSAPGYVGYEEGGQLSEKIRKKPYSVVLFDEIEKAHPDIFNILLQVLDDGHITDSQGRRTDFKNTVIMMTSNTGARAIQSVKQLGFKTVDTREADHKRMTDQVMAEVKRTFRPEFLNRIDETIVFQSLTRDEIGSIADLMFKEISGRVLEAHQLHLELTEAARVHFIEKGYDPAYGARPLRRLLQSELENGLADVLLQGEVKDGDTVEVRFENDKIVLARKEK